MEQTTGGRPGWGGRVVFFLAMPAAPRMHHGNFGRSRLPPAARTEARTHSPKVTGQGERNLSHTSCECSSHRPSSS